MSATRPSLIISQFDDKEGDLWMLASFGEISRLPMRQDVSVISVNLLRQHEDYRKFPFEDLMPEHFCVPQEAAVCRVQVHVSFLAMLFPGSLWRHGRYLGQVTLSSGFGLGEKVRASFSPTAGARIVTWAELLGARTHGVPEAEDKPLLPADCPWVPPEATGAKCLLAPVGRAEAGRPLGAAADFAYYLVLPDMVVARSFYCNSRALAIAVFNGGLTATEKSKPNGIYSEERSIPLEDGTMFVQLRMMIPDEDVWTVLLLCHGERGIARRNCQRIYDSMMVERVNGRPGHPEVWPPDEAPMTLRVEGQAFDAGHCRAFVVSKLLSTSMRFPSEAPAWGRDNDGRKNDLNRLAERIAWMGHSRTIRGPLDAGEKREEEGDGSDKGGGEIVAEPGRPEAGGSTKLLLPSDCFEFLKGKRARKIEKTPGESRAGRSIPGKGPAGSPYGVEPGTDPGSGLSTLNLGNVLDDSNAESGADQDEEAVGAPKLPATPETLAKLMAVFEVSGAECEWQRVCAADDFLPPGDDASGYFPGLARTKWGYFGASLNQVPRLRRRVWIIHVRLQTRHVYLCEAERQKGEEFTYLALQPSDGSGRVLAEAELLVVLLNCVKAKSMTDKLPEGVPLLGQKYKHVGTVESLALRITGFVGDEDPHAKTPSGSSPKAGLPESIPAGVPADETNPSLPTPPNHEQLSTVS